MKHSIRQMIVILSTAFVFFASAKDVRADELYAVPSYTLLFQKVQLGRPAEGLVYSTLPTPVSVYRQAPVRQVDYRVEKLKDYFAMHDSELVDYADEFVSYADAYELGDENWSLVAAIAGVESTFGKRIPYKSYNAWGWGIPTGSSSGIGFENWEDGIETVTRGLKYNYIDKGADTVEKMGPIYAPPSKTWAGKVRYFMNEIDEVTPTPKLTL